jgi:hypothetical protein
MTASHTEHRHLFKFACGDQPYSICILIGRCDLRIFGHELLLSARCGLKARSLDGGHGTGIIVVGGYRC